MVRVAGLAGATLIGGALFRAFGHDLGDANLTLVAPLLGGGLVVVLFLLFRWQFMPAAPARAPVAMPARVHAPPAALATESSLDAGVRDIRRTDPGFDPSRFVGYAGMMFRDAQRAWTARDVGSLRDRITAEMHGALQAQDDRLRRARRANRVSDIEITAEVTEAWQESDRDYVTAYIGGSIVDYTVDEASDRVVEGSRTKARDVDEFWTFTRPRGLHFWMLSAIEAS